MVSGRRDDETAYAEDSVSYGRFITPDAPMPSITPAPYVAPAPEPAAPELVEKESYRRASFTWDPGPAERAARMESGVVGEIEAPSVVETQESPETIESAAAAGAREAFHQDKATENIVQIDPWADLMQKALSETDIGRKFESPADRANAAAKDNEERLAGHPDRRAS